MTPEEHKEEAERLLTNLKEMTEEYVGLGTHPTDRKMDLMTLAAMISARAGIHARLACAPMRPSWAL